MDISILKYCPHCEAPLPPAKFEECISTENKCICCVINPPAEMEKKNSKCNICDKELIKADFEHKLACVTPNILICIDCLKAKRIAEREKGVYLCDVCNTELTPLDFFEREAIVSQMLILCSECKEKNPQGIVYQIIDETPETVNRTNIADETKNQVQSKIENKESNKDKNKQKFKAKHKNKIKKHSSKKAKKTKDDKLVIPDILDENYQSSDEKEVSRHQRYGTISGRFQPDKGLGVTSEIKAALGCLVFLVVALCVLIALILFNFYNKSNVESQKDILMITNLLTERMKDFSERVDRMNQRIYQLEQNMLNTKIDTSENEQIKNASDITEDETPDEIITENDEHDKIEVPAVVKEAYEKLTSEKASDRLDAVMDIYRLYYRPAAPILLEIVRNDKDEYVKTFAIKTLVAFKESKLLPLLRNIIFIERSGIVLEEAQKAIRTLESTSNHNR